MPWTKYDILNKHMQLIRLVCHPFLNATTLRGLLGPAIIPKASPTYLLYMLRKTHNQNHSFQGQKAFNKFITDIKVLLCLSSIYLETS